MAFLYIDRIKSDFQRYDHCLPRKTNCGRWCPEIVIKRLSSQGFDDYYISKKFPVKKDCMDFIPKIPKIVTIGLKLDHQDNNNKNAHQFWGIAIIKNILMRYLSFIHRYQNISWKTSPNVIGSNPWCVFFFSYNTVFYCTHISNHTTLHCTHSPHDCEVLHNCNFSKKHSCELEPCDDERVDQCQFVENTKKTKDACNDNTLVADKIDDRQSDYTVTKSTKFVSESEYNSRRTTYNRPYNNQIVKSKKNVCCQTDRSYPIKSEKHVKHNEKENYTSANTSSSKDVKTIFATDRANFDSERSKTNLELLGIRHMKKVSSKKHRSNTTDKRPRKYDTENSSRIRGKENKFVKLKRHGPIKNINLLPETFFDSSSVTNFASDNLTKILRKYSRRKDALIENKKYDLRRMLNNRMENDVDIPKSIACNDTYFIDSIDCVEDEEGIMLENSVPFESNVNSPETSHMSWKSNNYLVEDKTSEVMILGNVKKRLEEDYDDYFSLHDDDLYHDAEDSNDILEIDQPSTEITMNHYDYYRYTLYNYPNEPKSTNHQKTKQELTELSVQTSRNCTSSTHKFRFANSNLNCNYSSLRERECSPSSSIEYCSARDVSLSKLQSSHDNCFSNDVSFKDDNMFQDTREFFDHIPVDSYTVCCYQRNSTPNFSNSSKLITESLDSGTLTDCSRDQFRITSNERPNEENEKVREEWKGYVRKVDLLPTYDFDTDSSYSDESLNRRIDVVIKGFTENLILSERQAKTKLRKMENSTRHRQTSKRRKNRQQVCLEVFSIGCGYFNWRMRLSVGLYNSLYNSLSDSSKAMRKFELDKLD